MRALQVFRQIGYSIIVTEEDTHLTVEQIVNKIGILILQLQTLKANSDSILNTTRAKVLSHHLSMYVYRKADFTSE